MHMHIHRPLCAGLAEILLLSSLTACGTKADTDTDTTSSESSSDASDDATATTAETEDDSVTEADTSTDEPDLPLRLVQDGASNFVIQGENETAQYTLADRIAAATGATLSVVPTHAEADAVGSITLVAAEDVGNYGYRISVDGTTITLAAASLAGYDNAIDRLLSDAAAEDGLRLPPDYAVEEIQNWDTDYDLAGAEDYNADYRDGLFYNDKNDSVAYVTNAMWHMFGVIDDGQDLVYRFGNEPTWYEWMSEKIAWSGDTAYINELKDKVQSFPQTSTGYMWSWGDKPFWQVDTCYSIHYDGTFRYIASVYDIISWEGNTNFLDAVDSSTADGTFAALDASEGRTVLEKTEACMNYILEYLHGKDGYILLTEASTYLDATGSERFDYVPATGEYCWNNTGRDGSIASNYWDNLCFGHYDAYENALFYQALNSMAGIYRMLGGDYIAKAEELETLAVTVKATYNELYWSEEAGRYIACIDADGRRVDYGFTFLNFEAMKYGLADAEQAQAIFDWIDGDREVAGDRVTGTSILSYARILSRVDRNLMNTAQKLGLRLAPITNTVPINNSENKATGVAWWHGPDGIDVWGSAAYGYHLENGGYIFYPVFYELMARTATEGAQSSTERLAQIASVYEFNRLNTDLAATGSADWLEGLIGEFPESGLVPTAYLYSFLGVSAAHDGLHVAPAFNEVYETMGVKQFTYGGHNYGLEVRRDGSCTLTATDGVADLTLYYTPTRFGTRNFTVTLVGTDGQGTVRTASPDENGVLHIDLDDLSVTSVVIEPVLG